MKRKKEEEVAITEVLSGDEEVTEERTLTPKPKKKTSISEFISTAKSGIDTVQEFYGDWIKPVHDNWPQIKRRCNLISTIISVMFFLLYVPFLLFGKIADGLSLGWDIALYACIGVYAVTIITMVAITVLTNRSNTVEVAQKRKRAGKIIMTVVRVASIAVGITAVILAGNDSGSAFDIIALILAIVSIIFSALPLIFGGALGFFKWLISPAVIKRRFSFVLLEWYELVNSAENKDERFKIIKKTLKKHTDDVGRVIDGTLIPALGNVYIQSLDGKDIVSLISGLDDYDGYLAALILKNTFDYAVGCGYVKFNPCDEPEVEELFSQIEAAGKEKTENGKSWFARFFRTR